jgi:hypothetical protein
VIRESKLEPLTAEDAEDAAEKPQEYAIRQECQ